MDDRTEYVLVLLYCEIHSQQFTDLSEKSFRLYKDELKKVESLRFEWSKRQQELLKLGLSEKQAQMLQKENKKNANLRFLKTHGGPLSSEEEVETFMKTDFTEKEKQNRLKAEIQYCRDTCISLQRDNAMFKIMNVVGNKRSTKSAIEFAENLKRFHGKISNQGDESTDTLQLFRLALQQRKTIRENA